MKKKLTIDSFPIYRRVDRWDFMAFVRWEDLKEILGKKDYKKFSDWITGQTVLKLGVYPHDLEKFLKVKDDPKKLKELWD